MWYASALLGRSAIATKGPPTKATKPAPSFPKNDLLLVRAARAVEVFSVIASNICALPFLFRCLEPFLRRVDETFHLLEVIDSSLRTHHPEVIEYYRIWGPRYLVTLGDPRRRDERSAPASGGVRAQSLVFICVGKYDGGHAGSGGDGIDGRKDLGAKMAPGRNEEKQLRPSRPPHADGHSIDVLKVERLGGFAQGGSLGIDLEGTVRPDPHVKRSDLTSQSDDDQRQHHNE
jgi:hypothetical protein